MIKMILIELFTIGKEDKLKIIFIIFFLFIYIYIIMTRNQSFNKLQANEALIDDLTVNNLTIK